MINIKTNLAYTEIERLEVGPLLKGTKDARTAKPHHNPDEEHSDDHFALDHSFDLILFFEPGERERDVLGRHARLNARQMCRFGEPVDQAPLELLNNGVAERDDKESQRTDAKQAIKEENDLSC